jgi:hypothetical protein
LVLGATDITAPPLGEMGKRKDEVFIRFSLSREERQ